MKFAIRTSHGSILRRLVLRVTCLTALTIAALAALSLLLAASLARQSALSDIGAFSSVAEESLEKSLRDARLRASALAAREDVRTLSADARSLMRVRDADALPVLGLALRSRDGSVIAEAGEELRVPGVPPKDTLLFPFVSDAGTLSYDVHTPVRGADGAVAGTLSVRYDASAVVAKLTSLSSALGKTGEAMFSLPGASGALVFRPSTDARDASLLHLPADAGTPTVRALAGLEGVAETTDDEGRDVFAAYRYLPDIGWGFVMTVGRDEAFAQVALLGRLIALVGFFLLLLAAVVATAFSRGITRPLRSLAGKVSGLRPDHWEFARTVSTHDEVEVLDAVVADMAGRLQKVYEDMEGAIRERTQELGEQYVRDRAILENIGYAVITVDTAGVITDANPAASALLGVENGLEGKRAADAVLFRSHHGNPLPGDHPVAACLKAGVSARSDSAAHWSVQKADQSLVPVSWSVSPLLQKGVPFGAILVLQDVSEERRLDYLKSEFITLASHQLRTPLSALRWYVELMQEEGGSLTDAQKGYMKEMGVSLSRMANLLDSLLRASQMEENGLGVTLSSVDVNRLVTETDEDFRSIAAEHAIAFSSSLPDVSVDAVTDPTLLRIVLQNLLSNATKYTPKGAHVRLELSRSGPHFSITVADEGMGIPPAEQKRVFQKFFRAKNVRQMDTDGNGLGLYITKSIVERLGGAIGFKSEEGKGTTFTVTFPLAGPEAKAA